MHFLNTPINISLFSTAETLTNSGLCIADYIWIIVDVHMSEIENIFVFWVVQLILNAILYDIFQSIQKLRQYKSSESK